MTEPLKTWTSNALMVSRQANIALIATYEILSRFDPSEEIGDHMAAARLRLLKIERELQRRYGKEEKK